MRRHLTRRLLALLAALLLAGTLPSRGASSFESAARSSSSDADQLGHDSGDCNLASITTSRGAPASRSLPRTDPVLHQPVPSLSGPSTAHFLDAHLPRALHPSVAAARRGARAPPAAA